MQRTLGYMRKAIQEFDLIENGDRIAVGVSGGKDSLVMLRGLVMLRRFIGIDYEIVAITLDQNFGGVAGCFDGVADMCRELGIEYYVIHSRIAEIVFDVRHEENPCSLCARMRRGALHDAAKAHGCNKLALAHNYDDAIETFVMNLVIEGRIDCFSPKTYLSRKDITVIRPLVFAPEKEVKAAARRNKLPVVQSRCPANGKTMRTKIQHEIYDFERRYNGLTARLFGAMRRAGINGWGYKNKPCDDKDGQ